MIRMPDEKHWTRRELPRELHWQFVVAAMALYILGSTLGVTLFQSPNLKAIMSAAPAERAGGASGMVAMARLHGQALGAALVALCFGIAGSQGPVLALWLGAGFAALGACTSAARLWIRAA